jgi:hypothetical protein
VDTSGTLVGTDVDGPFAGASELSQSVLKSQEALGCFVKQIYRYAMGQEETPQAAPVLSAVQGGFTVDARITDALTSLLSDPAFVLRTTSAPAGQTGP